MTDVDDTLPTDGDPGLLDNDDRYSTEGNADDHTADCGSPCPDDFPIIHTYSPVHYTSPVPLCFTDQESGVDSALDSFEVKQAGIAGLQNLGNTCFVNAGLQCLFSNSAVSKYFLEMFDLNEPMLHTLTGQYAALLKQVWSAQHSVIRPSKFKEVLGSYYPQFKDFRQHDCQEFLALLLDSFHEQLNEVKGDGRVMSSDEEGERMECCDTPAVPNNMLYSTSPLPKLSDPLILNNNERCSKRRMTSDTEVSSSSSCRSRKRREEVSSSLREETQREPLREANPLREPQREEPGRDCDRCETSEVEVDSQSSVSNCLSEDSNLSESSTETVQSEDLRRRLLAIPHSIKCQVTEEHMDTEADQGPADSTSHVRGLASAMPSLEDFYMKDTKIQNTNVLASDFEMEPVATDSSKFHKHDNIDRPTEAYTQLPGFLLNEVKGGAAKPVKDTNLLANMRDKFTDAEPGKCLWSEGKTPGPGKCLWSDSKEDPMCDSQPDTQCNISNIKRIKIDEDEKNIRIEARLKMNTNKAIMTEGKASEPNTQLGEASWHHNMAIVGQEQQAQHRDVTAADKAWRKYLANNHSVIVNNLQGQFRSMVVCTECSHVSVTYEPFMYLSVPLPHAMERQFSVVYIACDSRQPVRYLVTVQKQGSILQLKNKLRALVGEDANNIVVAEVFHNHIARVLDDNMLLRFINDTERTLYAFEMLPAPPVEETQKQDSAAECTPVVANNSKPAVNNAQLPRNNDIFANVGTFSCDDISNNQKTPVAESKELEAAQIVNNLGEGWGHAWLEGTGYISDVDWGQQQFADSTTDVPAIQAAWSSPTEPSSSHVSTSQWQGTGETFTAEETAGEKTPQEEVMVDQWRSCAICLEEMADTELMIHTSCGGTLCQSCLDMSFKHYGEASLICPVCSCAIDPAEDFIQLSAMADYQPKTRILCVPVLYRLDQNDGEEVDMKLFGHPNLLYMSSHMTGDFLYQTVDRVVPFLANYSILLTDGQGYHCSRCLYTSHCTGCEIDRESPEVLLQPGDHLAVRFTSVSQEQLEQADSLRDHSSMMLKRSNDPLSLLDCFSAFTDSEVLDEHNPWYCPRCQRNCCAHKTITVWRYPNTLVVYLKRFVFHELSSTKIDSKVVYPLENLDLTQFISGPHQEQLIYDLHACVCHSGGVNAGHYTAYAKHPHTDEWHYFNDEMVNKKQPDESDYSSTYVLFYQRQGTSMDFSLPTAATEKEECDSATDVTVTTDSQLLTPGSSASNRQLNDKIQQLLIRLQDGAERSQEAQSSIPGSSSPRPSASGSNSPGLSAPGSSTSGSSAPGSSTSGSSAPGSSTMATNISEEPDSTLDFYS